MMAKHHVTSLCTTHWPCISCLQGLSPAEWEHGLDSVVGVGMAVLYWMEDFSLDLTTSRYLGVGLVTGFLLLYMYLEISESQYSLSEYGSLMLYYFWEWPVRTWRVDDVSPWRDRVDLWNTPEFWTSSWSHWKWGPKQCFSLPKESG